MQRHEVIIIGAGQGGLAGSHELRRHGVEHVVLERGLIGQAWRSARWDSFSLVTPNWMTQLPGKTYQGEHPDGGILEALIPEPPIVITITGAVLIAPLRRGRKRAARSRRRLFPR